MGECMADEEQARWAANLIADPRFIGVMDALEAEQIDRFSRSEVGEADTREAAWVRLSVLRELRATLNSMAADIELQRRRWKIL